MNVDRKEDYYKLKRKYNKLVKGLNVLIADAKDNSRFIYNESGKCVLPKVRVEKLISLIEEID